MLLCFWNRNGSLLCSGKVVKPEVTFFKTLVEFYSYCFVLWFCVISKSGRLVVSVYMRWGLMCTEMQKMQYPLCVSLSNIQTFNKHLMQLTVQTSSSPALINEILALNKINYTRVFLTLWAKFMYMKAEFKFHSICACNLPVISLWFTEAADNYTISEWDSLLGAYWEWRRISFSTVSSPVHINWEKFSKTFSSCMCDMNLGKMKELISGHKHQITSPTIFTYLNFRCFLMTYTNPNTLETVL